MFCKKIFTVLAKNCSKECIIGKYYRPLPLKININVYHNLLSYNFSTIANEKSALIQARELLTSFISKEEVTPQNVIETLDELSKNKLGITSSDPLYLIDGRRNKNIALSAKKCLKLR